ncbi:hypothetical protein FF011L_54930 [Roseimaritima multifibrata]|uniref:Carboxypeptidase regulatory-like domain-containing protein n=1 Tax=Roseimaritima multifibrata TaxID=1930274 RepID=A0A517MP72_9BACT|nr:hypothetical protein [Roseimaritima multifibrata]QDS96681.1 hypothetical protein FF011L_54930 [Roseimaritima multifibrata]
MIARMTFCGLMLGVAAILGCGSSGPTTYPVTGNVTYKGEPIETGSVVFDPVGGAGISGMGGIQNGKLTAEVPAGEMILRFSSMKSTDKKDEYGELITESLIPDKYNANSEIRKTISADGPNELDIKLE